MKIVNVFARADGVAGLTSMLSMGKGLPIAA